jgi:hypothetical protein
MTSRPLRRAASALLVLLVPVCGCASSRAPAADRESVTAPPASTAAVPASAEELEQLLVDEVPSGLPLVPDDELDPPAGRKTIDDVARYGDDAQRQRQVLQEYGYLRGWERFWRSGDRLTSVFLDQFGKAQGAESYAQDLAHNDAEYYGGELDSAPDDLPHGCVLMVRDEAAPEHGLAGPAAFTWCASGVFTVSVAAVAGTPADARAELTAVTAAQLGRLPTG